MNFLKDKTNWETMAIAIKRHKVGTMKNLLESKQITF